MKAAVDRKELVHALKVVAPAVATTANLVALYGVRLELSGKKLTLTTSDLDLTITAEVQATGDNGVLVAPHRLLAKIVASLRGDRVELGDDGANVVVTSDETVATIRSLLVKDWPQGLGPAEGDTVTLDAATVAALRLIAPFAGTDPNRPTLTAVHFNGPVRRLEATDSYRMAALADVDLPDVSCLVPAATLQALEAHLEDGCDLTIGDRQVTFSTLYASWTTRLVPGDYVNMDAFLGNGSQARTSEALTANRAELVAALKRVSAIENVARLSVNGGKLQVTARDSDVGSIDDTVAVDATSTGEAFAVNITFLLSVLAAIDADQVTLRFTDLLKPVHVVDGALHAVLMPVRVT